MFEFCPYTTNDGSVGLFSPKDDDIYHSSYGAVTEAFEKFILPANIPEFILNNDNISVLDICYGIGYNTKSFLNLILKLKSKKFLKNYSEYKNKLSAYNDKIYNDNINSSCYNEKIHTNNIFQNNSIYFLHNAIRKKLNSKIFNIKINSIEIDKNLVLISPFIKSKLLKSKNENFENEKIQKFLNFAKKAQNLYISDFDYNITNLYADILKQSININQAVNTYILENIGCFIDYYNDCSDIVHILNDYKYSDYFSDDIRQYFLNYVNQQLNSTPRIDLNGFLHNIYYNHISNSHKTALNCLKSLNIDFSINIEDARLALLSDKSIYDFVFLDAFTPAKVPCLWTYEFLKLIYNHLSDNGLLLTYSSAAPVRKALIDIGYYVGENFNPIKNKSEGTVASKNNLLIRYPLSEFDLGLLNSKAGINYRDENLNASNDQILMRRNIEVNNSNLISTSKYKKIYNKP